MNLIIAGAPYSGASVVGRVLTEAGFNLGRDPGLPASRDAVGLYLNRALVSFHTDLLLQRETDWLSISGPAPAMTEAEKGAARGILRDEFGDADRWGWVDPRTCLFLADWNAILPEAHWIFVVREPASFIWSTCRRRPFEEELPPLSAVRRAQRLWLHYNRLILDFAGSRPEHFTLARVPESFTGANADRLAGELRRACGLRIEPDAVRHAFEPVLMRTDPPSWFSAAGRTPAIRRIDRRLRLLSGTDRRPPAPGDPTAPAHIGGNRRPSVCVATRDRLNVTETFIRAHLCRLPARVVWVHGRERWTKRDGNDRHVHGLMTRLWGSSAERIGVDASGLNARSIARFLKRRSVEVVFCEYALTSFDLLEACAEIELPLVAHFHGFDAYRSDVLDRYRDDYLRLFEVAAALVAVSRDMVRQLESLGAPPDRIVLNPYGVDTGVFHGARVEEAPPHLLSVGRFVEKKAPDHVLRAFHALANRRPDARLTMVGDGPLLPGCRELASSLGIGHLVRFPGMLAHRQVAREMRQARLFVQHSVRAANGDAEGTPVAVLEAGATGLPVVATRHMGIEDAVIHGETGFLVEEGDLSTMTERLIELVDDPSRAADMGRRAQQRIRAEYSVERSIGRLWMLLESMIG